MLLHWPDGGCEFFRREKKKAADAVFGYPSSERAVPYAVVHAERGLLLCYGQFAGAEAKQVSITITR